jgi:hypothetical protein
VRWNCQTKASDSVNVEERSTLGVPTARRIRHPTKLRYASCASRDFCFSDFMNRRTYRLTPLIDRALTRHAKAQGVTPSVIVRDALSAFLLLEESTNDLSLQITGLKTEQAEWTGLLQSLVKRLDSMPAKGTSGDVPVDRVQSRFEQINLTEEKQHGTGSGRSD